MGDEAFRERAKLYATDIDEEALNQARLATYSAKDLEPVAPKLRQQLSAIREFIVDGRATRRQIVADQDSSGSR